MRVVAMNDFILEIEGLLSPEFCAGMIERFEADPDVTGGRVLHGDHGHEQNEDKRSHDLSLPPEGPWAESTLALHTAVSEALRSVLPNFPSLQVYPLTGTGYKIQKYAKGEGHFRWHFDALGPGSQGRLLALLVYLNDVEVGGETAFHHQARAIRPRVGNAIFFPTAWTHMHCGQVPESGDKYVVSSFFGFDRS